MITSPKHMLKFHENSLKTKKDRGVLFNRLEVKHFWENWKKTKKTKHVWHHNNIVEIDYAGENSLFSPLQRQLV